ncbi:MAG TPA: head GIN domain-containing protein [Flavisolibacter sp.]|nr:head GIN domain-containing protein [Flavisolibacter sp.]
MKPVFLFLFSVSVAGVCLGQKTIHDPNAEVRNVSGFHAIDVAGGVDLFLSGGEEVVVVSAKDIDTRNHIHTEIRNGVLRIWFDWKDTRLNFGNKNLKAYVSYKMLDRLVASGGSDVSVDGVLKADHLDLVVSGGSDFSGKVEANSIKINQSGGSDIDISGNAESITIDASGGSDFNGYDLVAGSCYITASGGSDIDITVNKEFSAEASGASDISWKGSATVKKAKASGSGSVSHRS